jgi:hypothetical protein
MSQPASQAARLAGWQARHPAQGLVWEHRSVGRCSLASRLTHPQLRHKSLLVVISSSCLFLAIFITSIFHSADLVSCPLFLSHFLYRSFFCFSQAFTSALYHTYVFIDIRLWVIRAMAI